MGNVFEKEYELVFRSVRPLPYYQYHFNLTVNIQGTSTSLLLAPEQGIEDDWPAKPFMKAEFSTETISSLSADTLQAMLPEPFPTDLSKLILTYLPSRIALVSNLVVIKQTQPNHKRMASYDDCKPRESGRGQGWRTNTNSSWGK